MQQAGGLSLTAEVYDPSKWSTYADCESILQRAEENQGKLRTRLEFVRHVVVCCLFFVSIVHQRDDDSCTYIRNSITDALRSKKFNRFGQTVKHVDRVDRVIESATFTQPTLVSPALVELRTFDDIQDMVCIVQFLVWNIRSSHAISTFKYFPGRFLAVANSRCARTFFAACSHYID